MSTQVALFANGGALASPLKGKLNLSASLASSGGRNRIGLKGARFRLVVGGKEVAVRDEPYLDIMVVGVAENVQRTFYKGKYQPGSKEAPTCFSLDGKTPDAKAKEAQCANCQTCPQNVKGSKVSDDGRKSIACAFSQRLIVTMPGDEEHTLYELNVNSISLFGDGIADQRKFPLKAYVKFLSGFNTDLGEIVHRVSFDMDSSVPKVFFSPSRNLTDAEAKYVLATVGSDDMTDLLNGDFDFSTEVASGEASAPDVAEFDSNKPADKPAPATTAAPKPAGRPKKEEPKPAPVVEPEVVSDDDDADLADIIGSFE